MLRYLERREILLRGLLVTLLAILVYASTIGNGFVWTDEALLVDGEGILRSGADLARAFTGPFDALHETPGAERHGGYYRPSTAISFTIDHAFSKESPAGYHAKNVLLHGAAALFLFLFLARLFPKSRVPFLASLLFAVHPIHTESVAWISARAGLLADLGVFLSLYLYTRQHEHPGFLIGALAAAGFALGAKESAVVLPALVVLARFYLRRPGERLFDWRREGPFFALLGVYLVARWSALGGLGAGGTSSVSPVYLVPTMLRVLAGYVRLLLLPYPLDTNDAVRLSTFPLDPRAFFSIVFLGALVYALLRFGRDRRETRFGLLWLAVALLPFLNVLPLLHFRAERFLYLPSAGFLVAAAALIDRWGDRIIGRERRLGLEPGELVTAGLVLLLAFGTTARCRTWKDNYSLFTDTIEKSAYAPEAAYRLGLDAYRGGAYQQATNLLQAALAPESGFAAYLDRPKAYSALGYAAYKRNDQGAAEGAFREALRLDPGLEDARFGLALIATAIGRPADALRLYQEILSVDPVHGDARYNLALAYEALDSLGPAEREYRKLLEMDPARKDAYSNLGSILGRTGRLEEALNAYRAALRLAPTDPKLHFNVGLLFALAGERKGAEEALRTAIELDPSYREAEELLAEIEAENAASPVPATP
jgi:tetratricopeptide (TPR) repeat protein